MWSLHVKVWVMVDSYDLYPYAPNIDIGIPILKVCEQNDKNTPMHIFLFYISTSKAWNKTMKIWKQSSDLTSNMITRLIRVLCLGLYVCALLIRHSLVISCYYTVIKGNYWHIVSHACNSVCLVIFWFRVLNISLLAVAALSMISFDEILQKCIWYINLVLSDSTMPYLIQCWPEIIGIHCSTIS